MMKSDENVVDEEEKRNKKSADEQVFIRIQGESARQLPAVLNTIDLRAFFIELRR